MHLSYALAESMLQILGTITLSPSLHGEHRWRLAVADGSGTVEAEHACSGLVRVSVDDRALDEFFPRAEAILGAVSSETSMGLDGMSIAFDLTVNGTPACAAIWGLRSESHGALSELVDGLWRLLYREGPESYRPYLEHIHMYFRRQLPLTWISPAHLRLYGRLSSNDIEALEAALQRVPEGATLDMSNFEGMGTLLYPLFRRTDCCRAT